MPMQAFSGTPQSGKNVEIQEPVESDQYLAGETVNTKSIIRGDLVAAAGKINIDDTIGGDVLAAGGEVILRGFIMDDVRMAGGDIIIHNGVAGDVVAFGGKIHLKKTSIIYGDVIVAGGEVIIDGVVKGNLKASGGTITINGTIENLADIKAGDLIVNGKILKDATISVQKMLIGKNASFGGNVTYWSEAGEYQAFDSQVAGRVVYDPVLKSKDWYNTNWRYLGMTYFGFILFATLSSLLLSLILIFGFNRYFKKSGVIYNKNYLRNFGFGILYFIGVPVAIVFLMVTLIGIPIGLMLLFLFLFTLIFGQTITSVVIAYWSQVRFHLGWNKWRILLFSGGIFILMNILLLIPIVGWVASILVITGAFGALILSIRKDKIDPAMQ